MLIMKIKQEIIVLSLENIVLLSIETLITVKLNHKIPVVFHVLKKLWLPSYYARSKQIQS